MKNKLFSSSHIPYLTLIGRFKLAYNVTNKKKWAAGRDVTGERQLDPPLL
jgi:hypothetical protein